MKPSKPTSATLQTLIQDFFEKHLTIERHATAATQY